VLSAIIISEVLVDPQVKFLKKKFSIQSLTVWVQEQFENFAKTVWEPLETANINLMVCSNLIGHV
jgi:hypothetical protein